MGKVSPYAYLRSSAFETLKDYGISVLIAIPVLFTVTCFVNYIALYYVGGALFLASILAPFAAKWRQKERISSHGKAVFITGCDSGFGHMLAQRLDDLGFQVFAGCLFPDGEGATRLRKSGSDRMHVISLDVTSDDSVENAAAYVKANLNDNALWAVVNNAGINAGGELLWTDFESIQRVLEVNTIGVVRVTKAFLCKLCESKGRIVTVASAAGRYTYPGMVPYCMSKGATISFCDGLRLEMYRWGIPVVTIEPHMYRTPILEGNAKSIRQTWDRAPKDVKVMYSPNYIDKFIKYTLGITNMFAKSDANEVVSVIEEAVTLVLPEYSYSPGVLTGILAGRILQRLPKPFADMLILNPFTGKGLL